MKYIEAIKNLEQGGITLKPITLPHTSTYIPVQGFVNGSNIVYLNNLEEIVLNGDLFRYFYYEISSEEEYKVIKKYIDSKIISVEKEEELLKLTLENVINIPTNNLPHINYIMVVREAIKTIRFGNIYRVVGEEEKLLSSKFYGYLEEVSSYTDILVEQGCPYKYKIADIYINGIKQEPEEIEFICDFEDTFLTDGQENYRVLYNPKVQSFKTIIAEQKIETIGGRFPLFVRNGNLNYKEIPISGLIAAVALESKDELRATTPAPAHENKTSGEKFREEREFKNNIERWLRNGQPKLFRSPAEGNYIIRLMNVSLSPEDKLSRMLHSFSATGYEIMEYNQKNVLANFLKKE